MKTTLHRALAAAHLWVALPALAQPQGTPPAPPPAALSAGTLLQVAAALALVLALVAGAAWLLRRIGTHAGGAGHAVRVIGGAAVGQRERVVLVEVAGTWLVVGVAPGSVSALHSMPRGQLDAAPAAAPAGFQSWLKQVSERRSGGAAHG